jgi:hypothetical protein
VSQPSDERIRRALEVAAERHAGVLQNLEEQLLAIAAGERDRELRRAADAVRASLAEGALKAQATERAAGERILGALVQALRDLDEADSLQEIFARLIHHARTMAGVAEIVMTETPAASSSGHAMSHVAPEGWPLVQQAARSGLPSTTTSSDSPAGLALPLTVGGDVVAVLYADAGGASQGQGSRAWPGTVEILARHASRCLEGLIARKVAALSVDGEP